MSTVYTGSFFYTNRRLNDFNAYVHTKKNMAISKGKMFILFNVLGGIGFESNKKYAIGFCLRWN